MYEKVNRAVSGDNGIDHLNHQNAKTTSALESSVNTSQNHQPPPMSTEENNKTSSSRESPFSARAAIKQTQQILSSTRKTTTSVLSTITDHKWWASAVTSLQVLSSADQSGRQKGGKAVPEEDHRNVSFKQQGCHPFYASVMGDCYEDTVCRG